MAREHRRLLVLAGFIGFGCLIVALLHWSSAPPKRRPPSSQGRPVRVLPAQPMTVVPRTVGYGVVTAQRNWQAVAQVSGAIVEVAEGVEAGRVVQQGTRLFKLDPGNYEIEQSRSRATVQAVRAQIAEIGVRESSARASLEVEKKALDLARKDYERALALFENELTSMAQVEAAERGLVAAEKSVQQLENALLELPASRKVLEAQLAQQQAGVEGARLDLGRTEIVAPFTMRIRELNVSLHQAVSAGQVLLVGDGVDALEVPAQFPIGSLGPLFGPRSRSASSEAAGDASAEQGSSAEKAAGDAAAERSPSAEKAASDAAAEERPPAETLPGKGDTADQPAAQVTASPEAEQPRGRSRAAALTALIRLRNQGVESTWSGKFRRFQGVDPTTRTIGVVVEVDDARRRQGSGPRLSSGLHVEVELRGQERTECLAIPRSALHDGRVRVVNDKNRLELRAVETELIQEQFVCIADGVQPGELVVLTDLTPAVEGMLLVPRQDEVAASWLKDVAAGESSQP